MTKYRAYYAAALAVAVAFLFWFHNALSVLFLAVLVLLPVLMRAGLQFLVKTLSLSAEVSGGCRAGDDFGLVLKARQGRFRFLTGILEVTVSFHNIMFDTTSVRTYRIPLADMRGDVLLPYAEEGCGLVELCFSSVVCRDLLGVTSKKPAAPETLRITVYPQMVALRMLTEKQPHGVTGKERYDHTKKGTDVSEIFDLREYQAGDPMHLIHWKLSQKTDTMIVREPGNPSQYDTLLYVDIGPALGDQPLLKEAVTAVAAAGISVSETLLRSGIPHCVSVPWEQGIGELSVSDRMSYTHMQEGMMGMRLQKRCGEKLPLLLLHDLTHIYSKMVYVAWGMCSPLLDQLAEDIDITAVLLHDGEKQMETVVSDQISVITISAKQLYEKEFIILI